ncbi:FtsX-like permease family protein [Porifericola rhodea]|uniref:ABC transporter permease n=1 Tax=Porifericola rhodea TaxID=930972 RepID=UPI0026653146|nr:FtsX-like permease family protein [Porifericola rhodea]WKN33001.1 FtsX-like permease family protein [Porifericola rhodea]
MNLPYFISKKINKAENKTFSATINKIAIASIALGLATMLVSFLILGGFKKVITNKIFTFNGHIQVTKYSLDNSLQEEPISIHNPLIDNPEQYEFIDHVQVFGHTAGLLQTDNEVYGAFIKGVGPNFDSVGFKNNLAEGNFIRFQDSLPQAPNNYSTDVLISSKIAKALQLEVGNDVRMLFINPPQARVRKLHIRGIYNTGIEEFDEQMIIGDIGLVRRINQWSDSLVGGVEIYLKDYDKMAEAENRLQHELDYDLYIEKVGDKYVQMFEWLDLINNNVIIFLSLILFVACFNIVSILLILIMERTQMIGVLKALGARNRQIRKIFRYNGMLLIVRGMIIGNLIGIGFGLLQYYFKLIPLDPENYYMEYVPIHWDFLAIIGLNLLTFLIVALVLNIPTMIILRINPIKAIRFD